MNDILEMYQELIIDHYRSPKNYGELADKSHCARGHNPLCGDVIDLDLLIINDVIAAIAFNGDGCAISKASASLMTESIKGKRLPEVSELFTSFHQMLLGEKDNNLGLGKLEVLKGVRQFPIRVKCATLCWHTLNAALKKETNKVTTE
jgi:nitrogen fixation protein NifU and related proteins